MKQNDREVVIHNNEKEKMLGHHALLCVHASEDTPSPFVIVRTRTLSDRETIIILP